VFGDDQAQKTEYVRKYLLEAEVGHTQHSDTLA